MNTRNSVDEPSHAKAANGHLFRLEHVVDVTVEEGQGAHEDFPSEPDENAPGSFVEIPAKFLFDPVGLHVEPGDLVHFKDIAGLHTVTAYHELADPHLEVPTRVPGNVPPFTSPPLTPGQSWVYKFTEKGVYDYLCLPHLGLGMVGRIVVFDPDTDDIADDTFARRRPDHSSPMTSGFSIPRSWIRQTSSRQVQSRGPI